ncbi:hypothetical protein TNCT_346781 [Trichonephila clavata]|uniref:Uncharacterized protein n=1 Tax=Trichonephila clavata TaxID=2740835 RepID=A0A8X6JAI6_TRICU|nr:hypothetical protein TNCT_346781 [Trichonephila clavata]
MANSKQCPKYPKTNPKKGDPIQNNTTQNKPNANQTQNTPKPVTTNNSYANVAKTGHQRSARKTESEQTTKSSEPDSTTKTQNHSSCSEIILAIREFKNFFSNHPELLSLGKALRNATSKEEKVDIFYEAMTSTSNLPHLREAATRLADAASRQVFQKPRFFRQLAPTPSRRVIPLAALIKND